MLKDILTEELSAESQLRLINHRRQVNRHYRQFEKDRSKQTSENQIQQQNGRCEVTEEISRDTRENDHTTL
jgi:hypothetical protein